MQNRIISNLKILLPLLLVMALRGTMLAQGGDSIRGKGLYIGLNAGPSQTLITNTGTGSVAGILSNKVIKFGGSAEVGYNFSKYIGLSSGLGYSSYGSQIKLDTYQNKLNAIDSEKEAYELRVTGTFIKDDQTINYLYVPIYLNLRLPLTGEIGLFLQSGVNLSFPLKTSYSSEGTFTYKGYYSMYNVLLENLPTHGFPTNKLTTANGSMEVKSFSAFVVASAGVDFFVNDNIQLALAATWNKSLSDVSAYAVNGQYQLSTAVDSINSFMGGSSAVSAESIGISVKVRYFFKF